MAVGLTAPTSLLPIQGISIATTNAGIRYKDRDDMVLFRLVEGASVVAVFTQNQFCAAPVTLCKQHLSSNSAQALLVNAGNANAGTGSLGMQNAQLSCQQVAEQLNIQAEQVLPFSTGVIGEQLPMAAVTNGIQQVSTSLVEDNWLAAANAIMTTDTIAKGVSKQLMLNGHTVTITGIAKGAGMICPNMATLLAYVATDAAISPAVLQTILQTTTDQSFNRITVDSDTSTNDSLVLVATGKAENAMIDDNNHPDLAILTEALQEVMVALATSIVRDAEGATKFVKINVQGGASQQDCAEVAYTVAHSPLVKTALFASDPNWGRILAAVGRANIDDLDIQQVSIAINDVLIIEAGEPAPDYTEARGQVVLNEAELNIDIVIGKNETQHHVWTSDLSHDYVSINADYRS